MAADTKEDMRRFALALSLGALVLGCNGTGSGEPKKAYPELTKISVTDVERAALKKAAPALEGSTMPVLRAVLQDQGNQCVSPASVNLALSLLLRASDGESRKLLASRLLAKGVAEDDLHTANRGLIGLFTSDPDASITVNSGVWLQSEFEPSPEFLEDIQKDYQSEFETVPKFTDEVAEDINGWVRHRTNDRIPKLFEGFEPATLLVLVNTITFDGFWAKPFLPTKTLDADFTLADGKAAKVKMMSQATRAPIETWGGAEVLTLEYKGGRNRIAFILPPKGTSPHQWLRGLDAGSLRRLQSPPASENALVWLPKFEVEASYDLKPALEKLGLGGLYENMNLGRAARMLDKTFLTQAVHKTFILVDEKGTEAAAATGTVNVTQSIEAQEKRFRADRPFAFVLYNVESGAVLFAGAVADPRG